MTIWTIAKVTLGEAIRRKVLLVFALVAVAFIIMSIVLAGIFTPREEITIVMGAGLAIITMGGAAISIFSTANLIPAEVEKRTIYTLLSKPVQRYQFVLGKFIGGALTILVNIAAMTAVFWLLVILKTQKLHLEILLGMIMIYLQMILLSAVAMALSVFTTQIITITGTIFVYIVGNMSEYVSSLLTITQNEVVKLMLKVLHLLVPNFSNFNIVNYVVHPDQYPGAASMLKYAGTTGGLGMVYVLALMLLAIIIFQWREI